MGNKRLSLSISYRLALPVVSWLVFLVTARAGGNQAHQPSIDRTAVTNQILVVFDIETTGFSPKNDRILELGAIKFRGKTVIGTLCELIDPGTKIFAPAMRVHGITDTMVKGKKPAGDVLTAFAAFIGDSVLVAHNAVFDVSFVAAESKRHAVKMNGNRVIDTMRLAKKWFPNQKSYSLKTLSTHLGIPTTGHHRALADAHMTHQLFLRGLNTMPSTTTISDLEKLDGHTRTLPASGDSGGLRVRPRK